MDRINVTPEMLESTASEFANVGTQVRNLAQTMTDKVTGLGSVWQGEAATAYANKFAQLNDDIGKIHGMIQEHVTDLNEMASVYRNAEQQNETTIQGLSGDVIS